jgi:acid phosphatase (class A)
MYPINYKHCSAVLALVGVAAIAGCASNSGASKPAPVPAPIPEIHPGILAGYLPTKAVPNSLVLLPPPPAAGSAVLALDEEIARKSVALRDTPRWTLATTDADYHFPQVAGTYSCALNVPITEQDTPRLYTLLRRTFADAAFSTYLAKNQYQRDRPFEVNKQPLCTPGEQDVLAKDGSYPSGHSAFGWAWALILSELSPEQANAILARGRVFSESRNVCNVHWRSDVLEGRFMGTSVVAVLHADPTFRADMDAAKAELAAVRAKGLKPTRDCAEEATQMNYQAPAP